MKKLNFKNGAMMLTAVFAAVASFAQPVCNDFVYYYSDINLNGGSRNSDIYSVSLEDGNANLSPLVLDLPYGAHIAFDEGSALLYVVRDNTGAIFSVDPATGELGETLLPEVSLSGITVAAINADSKLIIGNGAGNLYEIDLTTNPYGVESFDEDADIEGGDITFTNTGLYLASKPNGNLYTVIPGMTNILLGNVASAVTGMATFSDGLDVFVSSLGSPSFMRYSLDGGVNETESFPALLGGEPFTLANGDLASGCASFETEMQDCESFSTYYVNHGPGISGTDLYKVDFEFGSAILTFLENVTFQAHMAMDASSGTLFLVNANGNFIRPYDLGTSTFGADVAIDGDINSLYAAVYNPADGLVYVGDDSDNKIYTVSLVDGAVAFAANGPVNGGDLELQGGKLYLATRQGNKLYEVVDGESVLVGSISNKVNGMARANNQTTLITANFDANFLTEINASDASLVTTYPIFLDGESFTTKNGDMASGCADGGDFGGNNEFNCVGGAILEYAPGLRKNNSPITNPDRNDPSKASGDPQISNELNFVSLGYQGSITIGFDGGVAYNGEGDDILVVETTYGAIAGLESNFSIYPESAEVFVTQNGTDFFSVGTMTTDEVATFEIDDAGQGFSYITAVKIIDTTPTSSISDDAFDVDGIAALNGCGSIPLIVPSECVGTEVLEFGQGPKMDGTMVAGNRSIAARATGQPDKSNAADGFVSLGVNGSITLGFNGAIMDGEGDDIRIWETSFSGDVCGLGDDESADIELSQDGFNWVPAGTVCRDGAVDMTPLGLEYVTLIRITSSASNNTPDGYDLDGVEAIHGCDELPQIVTGECYATEVVLYEEGTSSNGGNIAFARTNPDEALGAPERIDELVFVSLGYDNPATETEEGVLILAFDGAVPNMDGDDIEIVETTYGNASCSSYIEEADVYVSVDGIEYFFAKTVCRANGFVDISDAGTFSFINFVKLVNSANSATPDAFDVDGVVAIHNCGLSDEDLEIMRPMMSELNVEQSVSTITAYPNPTTGPAVVEFSTANTGKTVIEVMDMSGRTVQTIFNQDAQAGQVYRVDFDGASLPNGIYLTRMVSNGTTTIEKMMIAR